MPRDIELALNAREFPFDRDDVGDGRGSLIQRTQAVARRFQVLDSCIEISDFERGR